MNKTHLFLAFIILSSSAFSQKVLVNVFMQDKVTTPKSDTIYYDVNKHLTWADFKGKPDPNHFGGAITASGFAFDADIKIEGKIIYLNIGVYTFFNKRKSWKKSNINSDYHLLHEQRHFDITRLAAEYFINEVVKAKFTKANYNQLMNELFDKAYTYCTTLQNEYDSETNHSINKDMQLSWNDKIALEISKL